MSYPVGLGWWVAFENAMHPGPKEKDLEIAIERAKKTGARWVALRAGDGGNPDGALDAASRNAWKSAGFDVYVWQYARPQTIAAEIALYKGWVKMVDGVIINAEFHHAGASADTARMLVDGLRAVGFDFIAHAPPDYAGSANAEPWNTFDALCDAIMPQVYAWEHNDAGHVAHLDAVKKRYLAKGTPIEKVWPILCSYRPKTRGFDKNNKPIPTPKMFDEPMKVAGDLLDGLEHEWTSSSQAPSIYSLDAITFINGEQDKVIETIANWYCHTCATEPPATIEDPMGEVALGLKTEVERVMSERDPKEWDGVP